MSETILVLGSNSFGGGWVVKQALEAGFKVIGISRSAETDSLFQPFDKQRYEASYSFHQYDLNKHNKEIINLLGKKGRNTSLILLVREWLRQVGIGLSSGIRLI